MVSRTGLPFLTWQLRFGKIGRLRSRKSVQRDKDNLLWDFQMKLLYSKTEGLVQRNEAFE
jgi:hypothetical protein